MKKQKIRILNDRELLERKDLCIRENLCFVTKEPLNREFFAEYHSGVLGVVKINQYRAPR